MGVGRGVAAVVVAAAVLDEDVEGARPLEAIRAFSFAGEPAAAANESVVVPH